LKLDVVAWRRSRISSRISAHVAIGFTSQHTGGCCVLLAVAHALSEGPDLGFQRGHPDLQAIWLIHNRQPTGLIPVLPRPG
jgi:hypothetical protein